MVSPVKARIFTPQFGLPPFPTRSLRTGILHVGQNQRPILHVAGRNGGVGRFISSPVLDSPEARGAFPDLSWADVPRNPSEPPPITQ